MAKQNPPVVPMRQPKGTKEGTDQASAERNLRLDYENLKADEREDKARKQYEKDKAKNFKKGGYVKAADGCAKKGKTKGRIL